MRKAHGRIVVHFLRALECLRQSLVILDEHSRQRIKQVRCKLGPGRFRKLEYQGFDFCERDHTAEHCPDCPPDQAAL